MLIKNKMVQACLMGTLIAIQAVAWPGGVDAAWHEGAFKSDGKPVKEFHCVPDAPGRHPAIVLLHAAGRMYPGYDFFEKTCSDLARHGYYTEFIEYYSQTGALKEGDSAAMQKNFPIWLAGIEAGIKRLQRNAAVDKDRIGLLGFSLGAFLSLSTAARHPQQVKTVVEYYGALGQGDRPLATKMPPTLIVHGDADELVPVTRARELDALLTANHRPHRLLIYKGANHAFNYPGIPKWYNADQAREAWNRTLGFFATYLAASTAH